MDWYLEFVMIWRHFPERDVQCFACASAGMHKGLEKWPPILVTALHPPHSPVHSTPLYSTHPSHKIITEVKETSILNSDRGGRNEGGNALRGGRKEAKVGKEVLFTLHFVDLPLAHFNSSISFIDKQLL